MPNPLRAAQQRAHRDNREMHRLFGRYIGSARAPRGAMLSAYRSARRQLRDIYRRQPRTLQLEAGEVLARLEQELAQAATAGLAAAVTLGQTSAETQAEAYQAAGEDIAVARATPAPEVLLAAPRGLITGQVAQARALVLTDADPAQLLGDAGRLGLLQPGPVATEQARWMRLAASAAFTSWVFGDAPTAAELPLRRQAVAAIDERTTDCCLRVHGQIVGLDEPFHLSGTPRFADEMEDPPFHWWCRTSVALYVDTYDLGLTERMRDAARGELLARKQSDYSPPHPANALTREDI